MMFVSIGIGAVVAIVLITVVSYFTGGKVTDGQTVTPTSALVGTKVKAFTISGLSGSNVTAPWKHDRAGVVMFFASYCTPCHAELPKVSAYLRAHPPVNVTVIGIDSSDERAAGATFVRTAGFPGRVGFDPNDAIVTGIFHFAQLPETVFVAKDGRVRHVVIGAVSVKVLKKDLDNLA
jgi:thiol-disulfide isomerase/thioredoxin